MNVKGWKVIGRGLVGWHAKSDGCSSSGGDLEGYVKEAVDGCLVYSAEEADREQFITSVIVGPMVKTSLPPNKVERFSVEDRECALDMVTVGGLSGGFRTYALMAQSEMFSGLDYVGVGVFEGLLRRIPGMRIGHYVEGEVIWE